MCGESWRYFKNWNKRTTSLFGNDSKTECAICLSQLNRLNHEIAHRQHRPSADTWSSDMGADAGDAKYCDNINIIIA